MLEIPYKTITYMKLGFKKEIRESRKKISKYIQSKNFPKLMTIMCSIENTYRINNNRKSNVRLRLLKLKNNKKSLKVAREKKQCLQRNNNKTDIYFSAD